MTGTLLKESCRQCGVERHDPARPFFPLWFVGAEGALYCPDCVPGEQLSPTMVVIARAQAVWTKLEKDGDCSQGA